MLQPPPPATMSRLNYHHVVAALGTRVPERQLSRALDEQALSPHMAGRVDQHRCVHVTDGLFERHGDRLLLARGFRQLHEERRFFPAMRKPPGDVLSILLQFQRYMSLHTELGELSLDLGPTQSRLRLHRRAEFADSDGHALALLFSSSRLLERSGLGRVTRLALRDHPGTGEARAISALFGAPPEFGADEDALIIDNPPLLLDIGTSVPLSMLGGCERQLRHAHPELSWSDSVRALLPMILGLPGTPLSLCASLLAVGERTLQRRVEEEGGSFSALLADGRRRLARQLLSLSPSTAQIAARLGYRQSAQFYRAFRAWFGESPGRLRTVG